MGKIFGISDLPVSTIVSPFKPVFTVTEKNIFSNPTVKDFGKKMLCDRFVPSAKDKTLVKARENFIKKIKR